MAISSAWNRFPWANSHSESEKPPPRLRSHSASGTSAAPTSQRSGSASRSCRSNAVSSSISQSQEGWLPLPILRDAGETLIVQFVAAIQGQLKVIIGNRIRGRDQRHVHPAWAPSKRRHHFVADRSSGGREVRLYFAMSVVGWTVSAWELHASPADSPKRLPFGASSPGRHRGGLPFTTLPLIRVIAPSQKSTICSSRHGPGSGDNRGMSLTALYPLVDRRKPMVWVGAPPTLTRRSVATIDTTRDAEGEREPTHCCGPSMALTRREVSEKKTTLAETEPTGLA